MEFLDKIGDLIVALVVGGIFGVWRKATNIDRRFSELELIIAKDYATKAEFRELSDKLDRYNQNMSNKIDIVNSNIMTLLRTKDNG